MTSAARAVVTAAILALAPFAAACGGSDPPGPHAGSASPTAHVTRWWSNSAVHAGSTIDASSPQAAARSLHASRSQYCTMLRQTLAAGRTILPDARAGDPAVLTSTKAFVAEIQKLAPAAVAGPWQVLGKTLVALVESSGDTTRLEGVDAAAVATAGRVIAADAKRGCGIDVSGAPRR